MQIKVFNHFNQHGDPCPVCLTMDDKATVLVPIPGTEYGNIMKARQVHLECYHQFTESQDDNKSS